MSKIICFFNQSGGVGKSTLTMNLGYQLSLRNKKVLMIDMDPQASLTNFMGLEAVELQKTMYDSIINDEPISIHQNLSNIKGLDLAPSNISLSGAELELVVADMREARLKDAIAPVKDNYDFILIDCPPSLGILSYVSLVASTHVLIPIHTEYKSLKGTELLLGTIARVQSRANRNLNIAGAVPTMYDSRTLQARMSLQSIEEAFAEIAPVLPAIPRSVTFADATQNHVPLAIYNRSHAAVDALKKIAIALEHLGEPKKFPAPV